MSRKISCLISCPLDTYSGYGRRSLDIVKQLIKLHPEWDIKILSQRWGDTRWGYLEDHQEWEVASKIVPGTDQVPDIWIQITVPNEFQRVGRINIGITAAMETNICDVEWINGCNRMDLVLTSSEHGKRSLVDTVYTNQKTEQQIRVNKPVEVLFEGVDPVIYFKKEKAEKTPVLADLKNAWNFLYVGHWLQGVFGEDRKNTAYTIKAFLETFKDREKAPGLILKTSTAVASNIDEEAIISRIYDIVETVQYKKSLPNIYFLHGDLTDAEMNDLYNDPRVKAMISFTKGEGYGRPLAEFASIGKPIIASGWSGQLDFLNTDYSLLVGGSLTRVHPSAVQPHMILAEASWFKPDDNQVVAAFNELYNNYDKWSKKAEKWSKVLGTTKDIDSMGSKLVEILDREVEKLPREVELKLPKELLNEQE